MDSVYVLLHYSVYSDDYYPNYITDVVGVFTTTEKAAQAQKILEEKFAKRDPVHHYGFEVLELCLDDPNLLEEVKENPLWLIRL